jgi:hypothetical protein
MSEVKTNTFGNGKKSRRARKNAKKTEEVERKKRAVEAQNASIPGSAQHAKKKVHEEQVQHILSMTNKAVKLADRLDDRHDSLMRAGLGETSHAHFAKSAGAAVRDFAQLMGGERKEEKHRETLPHQAHHEGKHHEKKSFPLITSKYEDWVDHPGLIARARDLHGIHEDIDLENYPQDYRDDPVVEAARRQRRLETKYVCSLRELPEVKEVVELMEKNTNKQNAELLVYEIDNFLHMWRSKKLRTEMGFRMVTPDKHGYICFLRQNARDVAVFAGLPGGSISHEKSVIRNILGKELVSTVAAMFHAQTKREILQVMKSFISEGWCVWTMSGARHASDD